MFKAKSLTKEQLHFNSDYKKLRGVNRDAQSLSAAQQ